MFGADAAFCTTCLTSVHLGGVVSNLKTGSGGHGHALVSQGGCSFMCFLVLVR